MDHDVKARKTRRLAANNVIIDGVSYHNHVVELLDGILLSHYPLHGEQAMTEWVQDTISIKDGKLA